MPFLQRLTGRFSPIADTPSSRSDKANTSRTAYQRGFRRYSLEFDVSVKFPEADRQPDGDQGELQDISGGGALFIPLHPTWYYPGQPIETTIFLAGTSEVQGCIRAEATVVRVEPAPSGKEGAPARVAVRFDRTFDFERIDGGSAGLGR